MSTLDAERRMEASDEIAAWLMGPPENAAGEQEDAWDWVKGIAGGAATGATTGMALGPYGALVGGLIGGGLGALQTAQQQTGPGDGTVHTAPAATASAAASSTLSKPAVSVPSPSPAASVGAVAPRPADGSAPTAASLPPAKDVLAQLAALLPLLLQLVSQSTAPARSAESTAEESGDLVPDEAFERTETANTAAPSAEAMAGIQGSPVPIVPIDDPGIEHGIPEESAKEPDDDAPEYPQASRFLSAAAGNYHQRPAAPPRAIRRIVIHITDGGAEINGTIAHFRDPSTRVSAHYIVGQDGQIVQMVRHNDVAYHAHNANADSIGIEHVANTRGLAPTPLEYASSAVLVHWLCDRYRIPTDREHILGHSEADPQTTHTQCPNAVWDWPQYMALVRGEPRPQEAFASESIADGVPVPATITESPSEGATELQGIGAKPEAWVGESLVPAVYRATWRR
ncbi:MAG TPA: N-acetylmuramoyl-L-alanine amidase [Gemmatimonadaceae bacterium]|nr:N-acetylmuramoyl-L-alanine amidase [Gemmatimonadaceae bacterium]